MLRLVTYQKKKKMHPKNLDSKESAQIQSDMVMESSVQHFFKHFRIIK